MKDPFRQTRNCVRWSRVDSELPGGITEPAMEGDVGFDLVAMESRVIGPMDSCDVPVNCRVWLPDGWYADVRNRSSMARRGLYVDQNLIDNGYRGPMFVFIRNMKLPASPPPKRGVVWDPPRIANDPNTVTIQAGERIAQLVFHKGQVAWTDEVDEVPMDTDRAGAGFGSTGT